MMLTLFIVVYALIGIAIGSITSRLIEDMAPIGTALIIIFWPLFIVVSVVLGLQLLVEFAIRLIFNIR